MFVILALITTSITSNKWTDNRKIRRFCIMYKKTILIDLDGVLNNYNGFQENNIPQIKEGVEEFLQKLCISNEYEIVLFTTRNLLLVSKWLIENNIDKYFKDITNVKIPAYIYIDDRAIQFNGDFEKLHDEIKNFKVYWK